MFGHVLVGLDGSPSAETILPHVVVLATRFGSRVTLLQATVPFQTAVAESVAGGVASPDAGEIVASARREATTYLAEVARRLKADGLDVDWEQLEGPAARAIVEAARRLGADLIALCTHGRSGLDRAILGSVADAVVRQAPCPVLLVRVKPGKEA